MNYGTVFADGRFCAYDEARIGLLSHGLNYGTGCFEGIRGYWNADERELYLLHLRAHYERLHESTRIILSKLPHSVDELIELTIELCVRNKIEQNVYIRPLVFKNSQDVGVRLLGAVDAFAIVALPFGDYYDVAAGLKVCVSSWRRSEDTSAPARAKITGNYINSALAKSEAQLNGFDEAVLLSHDGHVSEGSAENIFMVKRGVLYTPDPSQNILEGVTRRSVMDLALSQGIPVVERAIDRSELYTADEVFFTGTAVGITFVRSVDHRPVGDGTSMGPITRTLLDLYEASVYGRDPRRSAWVTATYAQRRGEPVFA
jgi:branched-chain amino acid aminotransferase